MGVEVELATIEKPDRTLIRDAYGRSIDHDVKKIRTLSLFNHSSRGMTVNTHGDMLPFYRQNFTRSNSIVYCHYPIAGHLMDCGDPDYAVVLRNMWLSTIVDEKTRSAYFDAARRAYEKMMTSSTVLTNSEFSRRAIFKTFGVDSTVLHPPVDTDVFCNAGLSSDCRDDSILVVSRFHSSKKIENAIRLAKLLKQNDLGSEMTIVGNMSPGGIGYFGYLRQLARHHDLEDFVRFEVNAKFDRLLELMRRAKVYFHPLPGEPFGISTVEAMSAGLIPVVPDIGGHTEFVPAKYQFHTFGQGVEAVAAALEAPASERIMISNLTRKYSTASYVKKFQQIVNQVIGMSKPLAPVVSVPKRLSESTAA